MKSFLTALRFLTIIPVRGKDGDLEKSIMFFPIVGFLLGLILVGVNLILSPFLQELTVRIILVVLLALLTGALHLDGVADTFDALGSGKSREEKLKIMRDSHLGAIGAVAVCCMLLLKLSGLFSIPSEFLNRVLVLVPVLGRWSLVGGCTFFSYAHSGGGKGLIFMKNRNIGYFVTATVFTFMVSLISLSLEGLIVFVLAGMAGFLLMKFLNRIFGGVSGDMLGMLNESIEVLSLFFIVIIYVTY